MIVVFLLRALQCQFFHYRLVLGKEVLLDTLVAPSYDMDSFSPYISDQAVFSLLPNLLTLTLTLQHRYPFSLIPIQFCFFTWCNAQCFGCLYRAMFAVQSAENLLLVPFAPSLTLPVVRLCSVQQLTVGHI